MTDSSITNANTTASTDNEKDESVDNNNNNNNKQINNNTYCYCVHASLCNKCGHPFNNREDTRAILETLHERPTRSNVFGNGPLVISDIPESSKSTSTTEGGVVLGIDEAGRGSVLGPMVYGMAYWSKSAISKIPKGFNDSKQLSEDKRNHLLKEMLHHDDIGFGFKSLLPSEISRHMLRPKPYNLNEMSHDSCILLIRKVLDVNVPVETCYIDTVGNPASYKRKLEQEFPGIEFIVESKADANYAPCSAASVVAKVMRDRLLEGWQSSIVVPESSSSSCSSSTKTTKQGFGSGYPSDPKCKAWMDQLQDPLFGYCDLVRYSWAPTKTRLAEHGVGVTFQADLDDDDDDMLQPSMSAFLGGGSNNKRKRSSYFEKRKLRVVSALR